MMIQPWTQRSFPNYLSPGLLPSVIERLSGTELRIKDKVFHAVLPEATEDTWSVKQHIGHLADLESLWMIRYNQIVYGAKDLKAADMSNAATYEANHNDKSLEQLLAEFQEVRHKFVEMLRGTSETDLKKSSFHERLNQQLSITDLAFFVAEHDDHHLAIAQQLIAAN